MGGDWSKVVVETIAEKPYIAFSKETLDPINKQIVEAFEQVVSASSETIEKGKELLE